MTVAEPSVSINSLFDFPVYRAIVMPYRYRVNAPRDLVWDQLINLGQIYTQTSPAHLFLRVRGGGPLSAESVIDCEENVDGEHVRHVFKMDRFVPGETVAYTSTDSVTTMPNGQKFKSKVHCSFVLADAEADSPATDIDFCVIVVLPNRMIRMIASMLGTEATWKPHIVEESLGFARLMDRKFLLQNP
jgi:hypothetical protein